MRTRNSRNLRNKEIYMQIASGATKDEVCKRFGLSLTQLNRIIREASAETEEWYKLLPRKIMLQIFRNNCEKILPRINSFEDRIGKLEKKIEDMEKGR